MPIVRSSDEVNEINLIDIMNGATLAKVNNEMKRIAENIADLTTDTGKRELVIKYTFSPSKNRKNLETSVLVSSKLAPQRVGETTLSIEVYDDEFLLFEAKDQIAGQTHIEEDEEVGNKVVSIKRA